MPRNSMVVVEGEAPVAAAPVSTVAAAVNENNEDGDGAAAADDCTDSDGGASIFPPARENTSGLGLVASIKYEPLRCHPSDSPSPDKGASPDSAPPSISQSSVRCSGSRGGDESLETNGRRYLPVTGNLGGLRCSGAGSGGGGSGVGGDVAI